MASDKGGTLHVLPARRPPRTPEVKRAERDLWRRVLAFYGENADLISTLEQAGSGVGKYHAAQRARARRFAALCDVRPGPDNDPGA
jgi:hypothetical protein